MELIPLQIKRQIYAALRDNDIFLDIQQRDQYLRLVELSTNVDELKSEDPRYNTFVGDFTQHCINNNDWDENYLFVEKLTILKDDDSFIKFLNAVVCPEIQETEEKVEAIVSMINELLTTTTIRLYVREYTDLGIPRYRVASVDNAPKIKRKVNREFRFIVDKHPQGNSSKIGNHVNPQNSLPCFVLAFNGGWDDSGISSWFDVFWHDIEGNIEYLGYTKILHETRMENQWEEGKRYKTADYLPDEFDTLEGIAASLGQSQEYYDNLKKLFPNDFRDVLWALQDCAIYPMCEEAYQEHPQFHSLIRDNAGRLLREEKFIIEGLSADEWYKFKFMYNPGYGEKHLTLSFSFSHEEFFSNRVYAIIGENGVGKTQFMAKFPMEYAKKNANVFQPHLPIFSKVITVSTCVFDDINVPVTNELFNYSFCGLRWKELVEGANRITTMQDHLAAAINEIERLDNIRQSQHVLKSLLPNRIDDEMFCEKEVGKHSKTVFDRVKFFDLIKTASSGECNLLISFCDILAQIRYDTLLLWDEPETHLHPRAVTLLMNALYELLDSFKSYAIITTHSPMVIREVLAENVYVIKRDGDNPICGKISRESFGGNIDDLTEDIFGTAATKSYYHHRIARMASFGMTYEDIMNTLKSSSVEPNFNLRLFVQNMIVRQNEKN